MNFGEQFVTKVYGVVIEPIPEKLINPPTEISEDLIPNLFSPNSEIYWSNGSQVEKTSSSQRPGWAKYIVKVGQGKVRIYRVVE